MRVPASSWEVFYSSTSTADLCVILKYFSLHSNSKTFEPNRSRMRDWFQSAAMNLISCFLLDCEVKFRIEFFILWAGNIWVNCTTSLEPLFYLWWHTSENVRFSPGSLCISDIPSMMVSDGTETDSVADTFSSSLLANTVLLVFFIVGPTIIVG